VSPAQFVFLTLSNREAFYGGSAGGGKSDALLAAALQYVHIPNYKALILRRSFTELSLPGAIMARAREYLAPHKELHWSHDNKTWTFPSGATLTFAYMANDQDMARYQSAEFQYVAYDELTEFTEEQYEWLFSRQRATSDINVPLRMRAASNPGGIGHGWVKRRFIDDNTRSPSVGFVPAKLDDHPDEKFRSEYHVSLSHLDDVKRRRLEDGDWDAAEGLAFQISDAHLLSDVDPPRDFERFESMDFGIANPTCVLAWAVDYDGNLIVFDSYYQANKLVSEHAAEIEARRKVWYPSGRVPVCYADPSMWARTGGQSSNAFGAWQKFGAPATDITEFEAFNIRGLVQANNKRRAGLSRLRELLALVEDRPFPAWHPRHGERGAPRMFLVRDACPELITQLRDAPLNEHAQDGNPPGEIIDVRWESRFGHAVAAARYGAMSRPDASVETPPWMSVKPSLREDYLLPPDELRRQAIAEHYAKRERELKRPWLRRRTEKV
jgi:hypothetical protein